MGRLDRKQLVAACVVGVVLGSGCMLVGFVAGRLSATVSDERRPLDGPSTGSPDEAGPLVSQWPRGPREGPSVEPLRDHLHFAGVDRTLPLTVDDHWLNPTWAAQTRDGKILANVVFRDEIKAVGLSFDIDDRRQTDVIEAAAKGLEPAAADAISKRVRSILARRRRSEESFETANLKVKVSCVAGSGFVWFDVKAASEQ